MQLKFCARLSCVFSKPVVNTSFTCIFIVQIYGHQPVHYLQYDTKVRETFPCQRRMFSSKIRMGSALRLVRRILPTQRENA